MHARACFIEASEVALWARTWAEKNMSAPPSAQGNTHSPHSQLQGISAAGNPTWSCLGGIQSSRLVQPFITSCKSVTEPDLMRSQMDSGVCSKEGGAKVCRGQSENAWRPARPSEAHYTTCHSLHTY